MATNSFQLQVSESANKLKSGRKLTESCKCLLILPECPKSILTYLVLKFNSSHLRTSVSRESK